jgi:hypothetical protein
VKEFFKNILIMLSVLTVIGTTLFLTAAMLLALVGDKSKWWIVAYGAWVVIGGAGYMQLVEE